MLARGPLSTPTSRRGGQHWSTAPTLQKPCLSRSVLAPSAGLDRKKLMSFLCSKVHGNKQQQAGVGAAPEDSAPASSMAQSPEPIAAAAVEPAAVEAPPAAVPEIPEEPSSPAVARQQTGAKFGQAYIKVVGCGGGGGNAISRMISAGLQNVEFWAVNTDAQALKANPCDNKLQIGRDLTRGLGTGGKPALGEEAALESVEDIRAALTGADMVFITAGMGGGTGTGAAPVVAQLARQLNILTVGVVTHPFGFEGRRRATQAVGGIDKLKDNVDTLIIIPNDQLLAEVQDRSTSLTDAFKLADTVLLQGVGGISDIITTTGDMNVDFADIKAIMSNSGTALLGIGRGCGPDRAEEAIYDAINTPLLQGHAIQSATGIICNITSKQVGLGEVHHIGEIISPMAGPGCSIKYGAVNDPSFEEDELQVTLIATGFSQDLQELLMSGKPMTAQQQPSQPSAAAAAQQQQTVQQPAPAAAVGPASKGVRSPSPPNKGAPTFNGRNWL